MSLNISCSTWRDHTFVVSLFLSASSACSLWDGAPLIVPCSRERRSNLMLWVKRYHSQHKTKHVSTNILFYSQDLDFYFCKNLVFNQNRRFIMNKPACSLWTWRRQPWVWRRSWEAQDWLACSPSGSCRGSWCGGKAHHRCLTPGEEEDSQHKKHKIKLSVSVF